MHWLDRRTSAFARPVSRTITLSLQKEGTPTTSTVLSMPTSEAHGIEIQNFFSNAERWLREHERKRQTDHTGSSVRKRQMATGRKDDGGRYCRDRGRGCGRDGG